MVINADDYYGKEAYAVAYNHLMKEQEASDKVQISMVGFVLGNTLSENGGVTRGICKVDDNNILTDVVETSNIIKTELGAAVQTEDGDVPVDVNSLVSMNMWGLTPGFFDILETGFVQFLKEKADNYINRLIKNIKSVPMMK